MLPSYKWLIVVACAALLPLMTTLVGEKPGDQKTRGALQKGSGLAAKYPGDMGIGRDPHVLFAEDFESGALHEVGWERAGGFYDVKGYPTEMHINGHEAAVGKHSLELIQPAYVISPQWLHRKFPGQDTVYVRFYRKFDKDWSWAPNGVHDTLVFAGRYDSPAAADLALYLDVSGVDQHWARRNTLEDVVLSKQPVLILKSSYQGPGLDFGIGWLGAKWMANKEVVSHVGWDNYYSLPYNRHPAPVLEGGRWYCFEYMAKMNSAPDKKDGEIRLWVDGVLVTEATGLLLRNAGHRDIQWDHWMLGLRYGGRDPDGENRGAAREMKSWIDGIVVSTQYVGPAAMAKQAGGGKKRVKG